MLIPTSDLIISDFLPEEIRTVMEQGYAFKPSAPAPLSAAPPSEYPREAFGTRSSVDISRISHRLEVVKKPENGNALSPKAPHILFDSQDSDTPNTPEEEHHADIENAKEGSKLQPR